MLKIKINGKDISNFGRIETIETISIHSVGFPILVKREEAKVITDWMYDCVQRCTGNILYNNTIIDKKDVSKIKF